MGDVSGEARLGLFVVWVECRVQEMEVTKAKIAKVSWCRVPKSHHCRADVVCGEHGQSLKCSERECGGRHPQGEVSSAFAGGPGGQAWAGQLVARAGAG